MGLGAHVGATLGDVTARLLLGDIPRQAALARDCDGLALVAGSTLDAVGLAGSVGESSVEVTLLEVKHALFAVGDVLGEEVVEVIGLESQEDATTISKAGGQDEVEQETTEAASLSRRNRGRSRSSLGF
jgi:hypothetical protein